MLKSRKLAIGTGAAAVAAAVSLGAAGMAFAETTTTPEVTSSSTSSTQPGGGFGGHHGGRGGSFDAAALATKLGVDEAAVTEALQTVRESLRSEAETTGERPDRSAMQVALAAPLAEALGLEESAVQTALDEVRAEKQAERSAELQDRLDAAVADGTLTQAEADGAAKAIEEGVIGGGR